MGFDLLPPIAVNSKGLGGVRPEFLHKAECSVCPLNSKTRHMEPSGSARPDVYMLGGNPDDQSDREGKPFSGRGGDLIRFRTSRKWLDRMRWNYCVRTKVDAGEEPSQIEIECCRPSIVRDIEQTKPLAIFGFGVLALQWALKTGNIGKWRGRRAPVQIGSHKCWFYPMLDPEEIANDPMRRFEPYRADQYGSDNEFAFAFDMKRALNELYDLPKPVVHTRKNAEEGVEWVTGAGKDDCDRVLDFIEALYDEKEVGVDLETNGKRPYIGKPKILTVGLSGSRGTLAFAFNHRQAKWSHKDFTRIDDALEKFLYDSKCRKISHGLFFELEWLGFFFGRNMVRATPWEDTVSQAYVLDDRTRMSKPDALSLEFLAIQYFGLNLKNLSPLDKNALDDAPVDEVLRYNGMDAKYHRLLHLEQLPRLKAEGLLPVYRHHLSRVPTMTLTALKGVPVDADMVTKLDDKYKSRLDELADKIEKLDATKQYRKRYGAAYRPTASQDGMKMLQMLGVMADNADESKFSTLRDPIGKATIEYRKAAKVHSTYIKPMTDSEDTVVYPDGRMHPIISTCQTRTSRTASDGPNIQNWIKRQGEANEVRRQVRPRKRGHKIVSFDYAGIQGRNVAMESKDRALVKAFRNRYDIHADWMERIARRVPEWISGHDLKDKDTRKEFRQLAKNQFVFPTFFGASGRSVARGIGIPEDMGFAMHDEFWDAFPEIKNWHERIKADYYRTGYVTGLSGYRRRAPVQHTELINTPIQADEAIIVCDAMTRLSEYDDDHLQAILMVHDDLTFDIPEKQVDELAEIIIKEMVSVPFEWANIVPIEIEMSIGDNWNDLKDAGKFESTENGGYREIK